MDTDGIQTNDLLASDRELIDAEAELDQSTATVREASRVSTEAYARQRDAIRAALTAGMTQVAVARRTGLSQGRIAQIARS